MVITTCPRSETPGVELVNWSDGQGRLGRCVLAYDGLAGPRWRQLADVVVCQPQRSRDDAGRHAFEVLAELPGSAIAAAGWGRSVSVVVRGIGELTFRASQEPLRVAACVAWCYAWLVSSGQPSASRRACNCWAWGSWAWR